VEARPRGPLQRLLRWARREPALAARLITLTIFLVIIQAYHLLFPYSAVVHYAVVGVTVVWAVSSWLGQRLLSRPAWSGVVLYLWAGSEPFLLTALLYLTSTGSGPFLIGFPLLVAGAGLWFRVPLVWVVTVTAELAYLLQVVLCPELRGEYLLPTVLFPVFLLALGAIVAQQVQRVRVLSRHYEGRTLP
jgi:eukaryotic-like serine/threonine-protein kinase